MVVVWGVHAYRWFAHRYFFNRCFFVTIHQWCVDSPEARPRTSGFRHEIRGVFKYKVQDHFGLDSRDIDHDWSEPHRWYEKLEGFRDWYLLQHFQWVWVSAFYLKNRF
ncbi:DUF3289 family protein [Photobacterium sp. GJ3]|uniref:DUF3289 family protein n=1 Tax=Photobacterium sp. GJ3 TaxID=2829502 RepID=UPI0020110729|nr:DUF3289 family protein [Photobacterium sp. GJ3]